MATPTNISPEQFIKEVHHWGATKNSLIKVRMMQKGNFVFCRIKLPNNGEIIQAAVPIEKFREFEYLNLAPIAVPAVWDDETVELKRIIQKLEELNANTDTFTPDSNQSLQFR